MSSSTSSSDQGAAGWRGWIATFLAVLAGGLTVLYLFVLAADPFSTGHFGLFEGVDIAISSRSFSNAGRARDPRFDAAVIGNSRGARFSPAHLDALTGHRFVQLSVFATGPNEELAIAGAFARHHNGSPATLLWAIHSE